MRTTARSTTSRRWRGSGIDVGGQDRPRPLRRRLPRPEGPQRPASRGHRRPALLRPGRRRLREGETSIPNGPYRPPSAIQRGSVQFLSLGPGDPSTPNGPSVEGADRLPIDRWIGFPLRRTPTRLRRSRSAPSGRGLGGGDRPRPRRVLRRDPLPADQLRGRHADLRGPRRPGGPRGLARGPAAGLPRRAGAGRGPPRGARGLRDQDRSGTSSPPSRARPSPTAG